MMTAHRQLDKPQLRLASVAWTVWPPELISRWGHLALGRVVTAKTLPP